jgi:hypothetical protein
VFASLRIHRNYRLYFAGQLVSQIGTWLQNAAQAALRGVVLVFNNPSRQALIVQLVGRGELANAIAINSSHIDPRRPALCGTAKDRRRRPRDALRDLDGRDQLQRPLADPGGPDVARRPADVHGYITACFGMGAFCGALIAASRTRASRELLLATAAAFGGFLLVVAAQSARFWWAGSASAAEPILHSSSRAVVRFSWSRRDRSRDLAVADAHRNGPRRRPDALR